MYKLSAMICAALACSFFSGCRVETTTTGPVLTAPRTIVDTLQSGGTFETFRAALQMTGTDAALRGEGPFTVLVPSETAWGKLPPDQLRDLFKPESREALRRIVLNHIVPGSLSASDLASRPFIQTMANVSYPVDRQGVAIYVGGARIVEPDIVAGNGYINVIDTVLMPGPIR